MTDDSTVLTCHEVLGESDCSPSKKRKADATNAGIPETPPGSKKKRAYKTKCFGAVRATAEPLLPLPRRALTFGAKVVELKAHGLHGPLIRKSQPLFEEINKKLRSQRDARTENWDGLPRFFK
tara:strand:+ start:1595 stop:1963 length:369 start_codon:yes stop_codon:yes gene_type:complete